MKKHNWKEIDPSPADNFRHDKWVCINCEAYVFSEGRPKEFNDSVWVLCDGVKIDTLISNDCHECICERIIES